VKIVKLVEIKIFRSTVNGKILSFLNIKRRGEERERRKKEREGVGCP
jgi:hypothetical protein